MKRRSAKQRANDKRLGRLAKSRGKRKTIKRRRTFTKSMVRRRRSPSRRTAPRIVRRSTRGVKGIFSNPTLRKVMLGIGASTVAGVVVSKVAPQFVPIAQIGSSIIAGGPIGAAASLFINGGLGNILGGFGLGGGDSGPTGGAL